MRYISKILIDKRARLLLQTSYFLAEHKFETNVFHLILLAAVHITPMSCISAKLERLHVWAGRRLLFLPWGFQSSAAFVMFPSMASFLSVWPIHFHALLFNSISTGSWPVCCHWSSFLIFSGYLMPKILLRHLLADTWNLFSTDDFGDPCFINIFFLLYKQQTQGKFCNFLKISEHFPRFWKFSDDGPEFMPLLFRLIFRKFLKSYRRLPNISE